MATRTRPTDQELETANKKIAEFFELPVVMGEDFGQVGDEPRKLSGIPISGDDVLSVTDENGDVWMRNLNGDGRYILYE